MIEINKIMTVSTGNVSEPTMKRMKEWASMEGEYGALIHCGQVDKDTTPSDLRTLLIAAMANDCQYLHLDRDAQPYPGVTVYW